MMKNPAIVIPTYNRASSLQRLLDSLLIANYDDYSDIPLIISIDYSDNSEVEKVANNFIWNYGEKSIVRHRTNIGLAANILSCGDLTKKYDAVIVLEDDLIVSPGFYNYVCQSIKFYREDNDVGGISLYSYIYNEYAQMRFIPLDDGYDNYFLQVATSWGQVWTKEQWQQFRNWYEIEDNIKITEQDDLPIKVIRWRSTSWKKYYIKYLVDTNKYFVVPRISLTTNCGEVGTHINCKIGNYHSYLLFKNKEFNFSNLKTSQAIYDSHYELESQCLSLFNPYLLNYDLECDFYGTKILSKVKTSYLLTIRESTKAIASYQLEVLPQELNIALNLRGKFFHLTKTSECKKETGKNKINMYRKKLTQYISLHQYAGIKRFAALSLHSLLAK